MGRVNSIWSYLSRHRYLIVIILGTLSIGLIGENSLLHFMQLKVRLSEVEDELEQYENQYQRDSLRLRALSSSHKGVERIAREKYFMKHDNEDVYVLSTDVEKMKKLENEAAE